MHHELLLALSGSSGPIFRKDEAGNLKVVKELPFVHPGEISQLEEICAMGSHYKRLEKFIETNGTDLSSRVVAAKHHMLDTVTGNIQGHYCKAFVLGLEQILDSYRKKLIMIEDKILKDPNLPLSFFQYSLESFYLLFPSLVTVVDEIELRKIHGCKIMNLLYEHCDCGIAEVKEALERILNVCLGVFYKQVSAWTLQGLLLDQFDEFFITDKEDATVEEQRESTSSAPTTPMETIPPSPILLRGISGRDLEKLQEEEQVANLKDSSHIRLNASMIPACIPPRVAEKILFIGQSVHMFKDSKGGRLLNSSSILKGKEVEFLQAFKNLQRRPQFSLMALETEIDKMKAFVAEQLWRFIVVDADLVRHFKLVKEMYLLGRGELFLTFIDHGHSMMKSPPSPAISHDVKISFEQSMRKILLDSDEYQTLFSLNLELPDAEPEKARERDKSKDHEVGVHSWAFLQMNYSPPWPLHLIFTPRVMKRYNTIFRFLLHVKRTQQDLHQVWRLQMASKRGSRYHEMQGSSNTWSLRRQMSFFVDNLQYYLQVDVLESQFTDLLNKIAKTKDFETIQLAHDVFLTKLMTQSFITMKPVYAALNDVLIVCRNFSDLVVVCNDKWTVREQNKTDELSLKFERHSSLLFKMLSSVRSHQASPHLAQLLLRIDFNKFFTENTGPTVLASI